MIRMFMLFAVALCGLILLVIETPNDRLINSPDPIISTECLKHACQNPIRPKVNHHNKSLKTISRPTPQPVCPSRDKVIVLSYNQQLMKQLQTLNSAVDTTRATAEINGEGYLTFDYQANNLFLGYDNKVNQLYTSTLAQLPPPCQKTLNHPISFSTFVP